MSSDTRSDTSTANFVPRAFSGIQPTGDVPHLGNYIGALRNWVDLQDSTEGIYCIVDLHALSVPREPGEVGRALTVRGLAVTKGARAAIEAAGGKIED